MKKLLNIAIFLLFALFVFFLIRMFFVHQPMQILGERIKAGISLLLSVTLLFIKNFFLRKN